MTGASGLTRAGIATKYAVAAAGAVLAAGLVWGLRSLILPAFVGGLLVYICRPFVARLERYGMPRGLAVGSLLLLFGGITLVGVSSVLSVLPSETTLLELRVRGLYALHQRYQALMGLDSTWNRGNGFYRLTHRDLDPWLDRAGGMLALTPDERAVFVASQGLGTEAGSARSSRLLDYERANAEALEMRARRRGRAEPATRASGAAESSPVPPSGSKDEPVALGTVLSTWAIAPLIFLFLLWDTGSIKRGLLRAVPNRAFEPVLAVLQDVDQAVGDYVRGMFLECCALALTSTVLLAVVGVPLRWAIAIGIFAGVSNVVPYMGFVASLLFGLAYVLLAESVDPLLPFVTPDSFALWVVAAVALSELITDVVYEPLILGGSVRLHPLVVVIGVVAGGTLFGLAGMFLAIPTITIVRVLVASSARHLRAYGLV